MSDLDPLDITAVKEHADAVRKKNKEAANRWRIAETARQKAKAEELVPRIRTEVLKAIRDAAGRGAIYANWTWYKLVGSSDDYAQWEIVKWAAGIVESEIRKHGYDTTCSSDSRSDDGMTDLTVSITARWDKDHDVR